MFIAAWFTMFCQELSKLYLLVHPQVHFKLYETSTNLDRNFTLFSSPGRSQNKHCNRTWYPLSVCHGIWGSWPFTFDPTTVLSSVSCHTAFHICFWQKAVEGNVDREGALFHLLCLSVTTCILEFTCHVFHCYTKAYNVFHPGPQASSRQSKTSN